ncbi:hypothetical protein niasHT_024387 [Heterodera trifolii]|uniref:PDZ domain-containing protein n=1 Tax=Heterodera trifolii TaxID=157864 RepID=A0ABD2JY72_9BILA
MPVQIAKLFWIKTIIANGPAAAEGTLRSGDVLVMVNDRCMLGASQDDACQVFRAINVGEFVRIQVCRGYPLQMDPTNRIFTENVYAAPSSVQQQQNCSNSNLQQYNNHQNHHRFREQHVVELCKGQKGFGFTVYDDAFGQRVKSILHPDQCPNLLEGDTILEVNGHNVRALPHAQLVQMLHDFPIGSRCKMLVHRRAPKQRSRTPTAGFRYGYGNGGDGGGGGGGQPLNGTTTAGVSGQRQQQAQQQQHRPLFIQRSKTPGPTNGGSKANQQQQQQLQRQSMYHQLQHQQRHEHEQMNWQNGGSTTLPRSLHHRNHTNDATTTTNNYNNSYLPPPNGDATEEYRMRNFTSASAIDTVMMGPQQQLGAARMRPSSSTLGFCPTPPFVPVSALGCNSNGTTQQQQNGGTMNGGTSSTRKQSIVVNLISQSNGFGFHLLGGAEENKPLSVGEVIAGGAADLDGRLRLNDQIVEIDSHSVVGAQHNRAVELINQASIVGHVRLMVMREWPTASTGELFSAHSPATSLVGSNESSSRGKETLPYDVTLLKMDFEPDFGCTIISHSNRYIADIVPGSAAHRSARLRVGDCVVAVNGHSVASMGHQQVLQFIRSTGNTLTLTIEPTLRLMDPPPSAASPPSLATALAADNAQQSSSSLSSNYALLKQQHRLSNGAAAMAEYGNGVVGGGGGGYGVVGARNTVPQQQQPQQWRQQQQQNHLPNLFTVELVRGERGFGFSIRGGAEFGMPLFILKIAEIGPAAGSAMQIGDQLVEIDGESCIGMSHERAIGMIKERQRVRLTLSRQKL